MEIHVYPSITDTGTSEGLCSELGSNQLMAKDTKQDLTKSPSAFVLSWK